MNTSKYINISLDNLDKIYLDTKAQLISEINDSKKNIKRIKFLTSVLKVFNNNLYNKSILSLKRYDNPFKGIKIFKKTKKRRYCL